MVIVENKPDYECPNRAFFFNEVAKVLFKGNINDLNTTECDELNVIIDLIYSRGVKDGEQNVMDRPTDYLMVER